MKARRTLGVGMLSMSLALAGVALSAPAAWAFSGFAFIKGARQGLIQGDVTSKIASGAINLVAIGAEALLPVDPLTGKVTGTL
ncbi:MAG: hypothetical protein AUH81_03300 [Candidatus Rokubacteria bacterium 13_1_40CM_4_69_5]|nr:MAG: hypothetical protein AUH81_03300 [Candidatus Rokubacteria bacterium 13_1_40CM_4_69_5]